jgi:hypothetical protein
MRLEIHELGMFARFTRKMQAHYKIRERLELFELGRMYAHSKMFMGWRLSQKHSSRL